MNNWQSGVCARPQKLMPRVCKLQYVGDLKGQRRATFDQMLGHKGQQQDKYLKTSLRKNIGETEW